MYSLGSIILLKHTLVYLYTVLEMHTSLQMLCSISILQKKKKNCSKDGSQMDLPEPLREYNTAAKISIHQLTIYPV